jgi:vitamin B12 transporter
MMAMKRLNISLIALVAALPAAALAQDIELDEIVITANKTETAAARAGVSVTVVAPAEDAVPDAAATVETLGRLPGLSLSTQGPLGSPAKLRIRGADQRYIAVFVDGIRVSDPTSAQTEFDFGTLPAAGVGRIEVLRGSQSALWGGSAVAGVVNITSPRPAEDGTTQQVQMEAGANATANLSYNLAHKAGALETTLNLSHFETDGYSAFDGGTEADGTEVDRASVGLRYQASDVLALGANLFHQRSDIEFDGYNLATFAFEDQANRQLRVETGARVFAELATGNTDHVFDLTSYAISRDYDDEAGDSAYDGSRLTLGWQATTTLSEAFTLVYGADTMQEKANYSHLPGGVADTTLSGAFVQGLWAANAQTDISATARVDHNSTFGSFPTGRVALAYRPDDATTLRAAIATGYRAPSIDERFGDYPEFFFTGNADLTPEESLSYEVGAERAFGNGAVVSATLFRLEVDNLIASNATFSSLENVAGTSVRQGVELAATLPLGEMFDLGLAYTYTDARRQSGTRIGLVPYHDVTVTLDGQLSDRLKAGLVVKSVAGRLDDFAIAGMPDYTVVTAEASYAVTNQAEAYLRVENLFDADYQSSNGYATSDRALYVGLRAKF